MTVNYLKNQELHATDSVMDDRFKKNLPLNLSLLLYVFRDSRSCTMATSSQTVLRRSS